MSSTDGSASQLAVSDVHSVQNRGINNNSSGGPGNESAQTYFIGNLPRESTEVDVLSYFAAYGPVERFKLCYSSDGCTRGFGWLTFSRAVPDLLQRGPYRIGGRELTVELSHARIYNRSGVSVGSLASRRHASGGMSSRRAGEHMAGPNAVGAMVMYSGNGDIDRSRRHRHGRGHRRNRSSSRSTSRSLSSSSYTSSSSLGSSRSSNSRRRGSSGRHKTKHARHNDALPPPPPPPPSSSTLTTGTPTAVPLQPPPHPAATATTAAAAAPAASPSDLFVCLPMALCPQQFLCDPRVFAARLDRTRVGALTICGSVVQSSFATHEQQPLSSAVRSDPAVTGYGHLLSLATSEQQPPPPPLPLNVSLPSPPPPPPSSSSSALRHGMSASYAASFAPYASSQPFGVMHPPPPPPSSVPPSSSTLPQQQQQQQQQQRQSMNSMQR